MYAASVIALKHDRCHITKKFCPKNTQKILMTKQLWRVRENNELECIVSLYDIDIGVKYTPNSVNVIYVPYKLRGKDDNKTKNFVKCSPKGINYSF